MISTLHAYEQLSSRASFNSNLRHFKLVMELVEAIAQGFNLADFINVSEEVEVNGNQILPLMKSLILEKYQYKAVSFNLSQNYDDLEFLPETLKDWKRFDILMVYHHPELGPTLVNPKDEKQISTIGGLKKYELVTAYFGYGSGTPKKQEDKKNLKALETAAAKWLDLLQKGKTSTTKALKEPALSMKKVAVPGTRTPKAVKKKGSGATRKKAKEGPITITPEASKRSRSSSSTATANPVQAPSRGSKMVGPYSVPVTNELFHNGNVEAWKRIIESYKTKNPGCNVIILYDGERIHDINTLFKWGKVKHGKAILFAVTGDEIKDVAKLKKYLSQGASPRFEVFLSSPVGKVLNLF